jgi:hypothetical protein
MPAQSIAGIVFVAHNLPDRGSAEIAQRTGKAACARPVLCARRKALHLAFERETQDVRMETRTRNENLIANGESCRDPTQAKNERDLLVKAYGDQLPPIKSVLVNNCLSPSGQYFANSGEICDLESRQILNGTPENFAPALTRFITRDSQIHNAVPLLATPGATLRIVFGVQKQNAHGIRPEPIVKISV